MLDFSKGRILVIGDIILDKYFIGAVKRISPEAPVPVVNVKIEKETLGGAGNLCNNIYYLGGKCYLFSLIGKDKNGEIIRDKLENLKIDNFLIEDERPTITKIRVIGEHQHIVRVDIEKVEPLKEDIEKKIINKIESVLKSSDVIAISDYGKGFCTPNIVKNIIEIANRNGVPVVIDPKGYDWEKYRNSYLITPNVKEISDVLGREVENNDEDIQKAGIEIMKRFNIKKLIITRSEKGMTFFDGLKEIYHIPTEAKEVFDVSGAGDTVVAVVSLGIANKIPLVDTVMIANKAAGVVVGKIGTVPITLSELENAFYTEKNKIFYKVKELLSKVEILKREEKRIVFTNGCFDILHRGHLTYLKKAKSLGDILIVGLNSDGSVRKLKGEGRPINNQEDRALMLSSLEFVDYVIVFDDDTPYRIIKEIKPDILVKGGDYKIEEVVGREFAKETIVLPFVEGYSTTNLISRIKDK
ncbi:MAG TPA: D-glycero-beta-D-manno-heptose-7-phosphate kinase [Spirochaetota bacterium]|nr:D-glycero-beta-D-manno-heptose-7-phosphate kinase [Spirochaetota bacterium]HOM38182.1 D-glycero-beta-D-manno-heptose-7-phosphate kinase [Spirochaetota bacterium]HPQ48600.1 D-glycero-beta-D-manno-heptose-7-phosphate kinase [Spirochaetota bacterium]